MPSRIERHEDVPLAARIGDQRNVLSIFAGHVNAHIGDAFSNISIIIVVEIPEYGSRHFDQLSQFDIDDSIRS